MSYDLHIWSQQKITSSQIHTAIGDYTLSADESLLVEPEDIPAAVFLTLPEIKYLTELYLQPYPGDTTVISKAIRYANKLARQYTGIVENPQTGKGQYTGAEIQTFERVTQDSELVSVAWYMDSVNSLADHFGDLIDIFEERLPQALPRRYGGFEPPQHKYAEAGKAHLLEFLDKESSPVWYGTKPVTHVFLSDAFKNAIHSSDRYRCNRIELQLLKEAYDEANWRYAIKRLLKEVSVIYKPFYAEIIVTREQSIKSWWWRGFPRKMGESIIIGEPYASLLAKRLTNAERLVDGLYYLEDSTLIKIPIRYMESILGFKFTLPSN
jgi:hypothetical protein